MNSLNLASKLTLFRILVAPVIVILLIDPNWFTAILAALLFGAGGITDWLDGNLARSTGTVTTFGKLIDPIADKILILSVLLPMVALGRVPALLAAVMLAREFSVTGVRMISAAEGRIIPANWKGKYKVGFEIAAMEFLILQWSLLIIHFQTIGIILLLISVVFSLWAAADYFKEYWKIQSQERA